MFGKFYKKLSICHYNIIQTSTKADFIITKSDNTSMVTNTIVTKQYQFTNVSLSIIPKMTKHCVVPLNLQNTDITIIVQNQQWLQITLPYIFVY